MSRSERCKEIWIFATIQQGYWENRVLFCIKFILNEKQNICWQHPAMFCLYTLCSKQAKIQMLTTFCRILTLIYPLFLKSFGLYSALIYLSRIFKGVSKKRTKQVQKPCTNIHNSLVRLITLNTFGSIFVWTCHLEYY